MEKILEEFGESILLYVSVGIITYGLLELGLGTMVIALMGMLCGLMMYSDYVCRSGSNERKKMTEQTNPMKEKIKKAFAENNRRHKEFLVALEEWTESLTKGNERMAKQLQETK